MIGARAVHVVVPAGIADPTRPSGGNAYDRRVCGGLAARGWAVEVCEVAGEWPEADELSRGMLAGALEDAPHGSMVLVDGLVASASPEVMVPAAARVRVVVLVHMPLGAGGDDVDRCREEAVLRAATAVVTTSAWTRRWLVETYGLDPVVLHVVRPGVDAAVHAPGETGGVNLLCVGAVTPGKGHDLLVAALACVTDLEWRCVCVGPVTRSPDFVASLRRDIRDAGLEDRVQLVGPRSGADLAAAYEAADLVVLASRAETYGMVVTEALACGLPVVACDVGGVSEALGVAEGGNRPGLLVPAGDAAALAHALRRWMSDAALRERLRGAAALRRTTLTRWDDTVDEVARVLEEVAG